MSKKVIKKNNRNFIPTAENTHYTKKGAKAKWSFWVVLALMVFWSVGAVLGIFATARSCNYSASVKTVSAAEADKKPLEGSIFYNGEKFSTYSFNGLGYNTITSQLQISFNYTLSSSNCVYIVSRTGKIPGELWLYGDDRFIFSSFSSEDTSNPIEYYSITGVDSTVRLLMNYDLGTGSSFYFDITVIITSDLPFNSQVPVLYENGFLNDICEAAQSKDNESLGFFTGGTFRVANRNIKAFDEWLNTMTESDYSGLPYSSLPLLPSKYIVGFHNGVLNSFKFQIIENVCGNSIKSSQFLFCDFGKIGKPFGNYKVFSVFVKDGETFFPAEDYGIIFIFTDGSSVPFFSSSSGGVISSSSYIDLSNYSDKRVRSVMWVDSNLSAYVVGLSSDNGDILGYNSGYQNGFNAGKGQGYNDGYKNGYSVGKSEGKVIGRNEALASGNNYTFLGLLGAVVDAPITAISGLLNFNLLGFNMLNFFYALCTCALVIAVVRLIL